MRKSVFESILILGTGTLALNITKMLFGLFGTDSRPKLLCASYLESPFSLFSTWCKTSKIPYINFKNKIALSEYLSGFESSMLLISAHNYYIFPSNLLQNHF